MDLFGLSEPKLDSYYNAISLFDGNFDTSLINHINPYLLDLGTSSPHFLSEGIDNLNFIPSVNELESLTYSKNDVNALVDLFPSMEDMIDDIDVWSRYYEESLQYVESTPDVKLYYPEPFIASPSFVHEELWFIHILHYNH